MSPNVSVLAVSATPDDRGSTGELKRILDEIGARPGCDTHMWYLRDYGGEAEPGSFVVDSLRTNPLVRALSTIAPPAVAGRLRGLMLRLEARRIRPDVVILNDRLGGQLVDYLGSGVRIVTRVNADRPTLKMGDAPYGGVSDLELRSSRLSVHEDDQQSEFGTTLKALYEQPTPVAGGMRFGRRAERERVRRGHGFAEVDNLVVGWGDDGWLDGQDLFVRTIWALNERNGTPATGLWLGHHVDRHETDRLLQDAGRMGIAGRVVFVDDPDPELRFCGDAVLLPYRDHNPDCDVTQLALTSCPIVTFGASGLEGHGVTVVSDLDVFAAAASLAEGLAVDREASFSETVAQGHADVDRVIDEIIDLARGTIRSSGAGSNGPRPQVT